MAITHGKTKRYRREGGSDKRGANEVAFRQNYTGRLPHRESELALQGWRSIRSKNNACEKKDVKAGEENVGAGRKRQTGSCPG